MFIRRSPLLFCEPLYEGNFEEWKKEISEFYISNGRPTQAYPAISHIEDSGKVIYHKSTIGDFHSIFNSISPALYKRLPLDTELSVGEMYAKLEKLCQPFRLFDLPAELRNRVYGEAVDDGEEQRIYDWRKDGKHKIPALAQSTQQLRKEVLPVFFARSNFVVEAFYEYGRARPNFTSCLQTWNDRVLGSSAKLLRCLTVKVSANGRVFNATTNNFQHKFECIQLRITFSKAQGLQIEGDQALKPWCKQLLQDHAERAELLRKTQSLEGESILAAFKSLDALRLGSSMTWLDLEIEDKTGQD